MTIEAPAPVPRVSRRYDRQFYTGMAIAAAVVVFVGFAPTYFLRATIPADAAARLSSRARGSLHAWIALFIAQTSLVAARRTNVHRRLGWADGGARRGDGRRRHDRGHLVDAA